MQPSCQNCSVCAHLPSSTAEGTVPDDARWPSEVMTCPVRAAVTTESMTCEDYAAVSATVIGMYNSLPQTCTDSSCPSSEFAGCVLRFAGHDSMDVQGDVGGNDGCVDLHHPINGGLGECLSEGVDDKSLAQAYRMFCSYISLADFAVIASEAVLTVTRANVVREYPTAEHMNLAGSFQYGRATAAACEASESRMPNPEESCTEMGETFLNGMNLTWEQTAALMGAHTLGKARVNNSGYDGWWSNAYSSKYLSNQYFASIVGQGWKAELGVGSDSDKHQWIRSDAGRGKDIFLGKQMMLNTDLCMYYTQDNDGEDDIVASSSDCCAWHDNFEHPLVQAAIHSNLGGRFCGTSYTPGNVDIEQQRKICCHGEVSPEADCGIPINRRQGAAAEAVELFAGNDAAWLTTFRNAWSTATTNGFSSLTPLGCSA